MAKKAGKKKWEIKEEFSGEKGFSSKEWEKRRSWGSFGFGLLLMIIAVIWLAKDFGWIPTIPLWQTILFLVGLFVAIASVAKR